MVVLILKNVCYFVLESGGLLSCWLYKSCLEAAALPEFKGYFPLVQTSQRFKEWDVQGNSSIYIIFHRKFYFLQWTRLNPDYNAQYEANKNNQVKYISKFFCINYLTIIKHVPFFK